MKHFNTGDIVTVDGVEARVILYNGEYQVEKTRSPNRGLRIPLSRAKNVKELTNG